MPFLEFPRLAAFAQRARHTLESPRIPLVCAGIAALLTASSLPGGLATEDWVLAALARGSEFSFFRRVNLFGPPGPVSFSDLEKRFREFLLAGFWPWLTQKELEISFFRPVAALTHLVDFRFFGSHPWLMHLENVAWYAGLAACVAILYRRLRLPSWIAGGAAVLYAVDDAHGHPVGWLINRNALMAAVFGVLALIAYDRFRQSASLRHAVLTASSFAVCLLCAEYGLSIVGYFLAYTLVVDRAPWRARLLRSTPWVVTLSVWAVAYRLGGHGVRGSGVYVDPTSAPVQYAVDLLEHASVLITGQLAFPFSDAWTRAGLATQGFLSFWAVVFCWVFVWALTPLLVRDRDARFWALGALLSLPPSCSTFPEDRLLFFVGIGAMPVVVKFLEYALRGRGTRDPRRLPSLVLSLLLVAAHGAVAPVLLPVRAGYMARYERRLHAARETAFDGVKASQALVLVNGEDFYFTSMMCQTRHARGEPMPERALVLAGQSRGVTLTRTDDRTLEVSSEDGFMSREFNRIYRSPTRPLRRGAHVELHGVDITVLDTNVFGEPIAVQFRFEVPLDAEGYTFRAWDASSGAYHPFRLPPVGRPVTVGGDP